MADIPLPRHLYKYGSFANFDALPRLERILLTGNVWFANKTHLNDPFELRPIASFDFDSPGFRDHYFKSIHALLKQQGMHNVSKRQKKIQERYSRLIAEGETLGDQYRNLIGKSGIYCLSENPSSLLMWAHYATGHNGYRLTLDTTAFEQGAKAGIDKVRYQTKYPEIDIWNLIYDASLHGEADPVASDQASKIAVLTKSSEWEYEAEWRLFSVEEGEINLGPKAFVQIALGANVEEDVVSAVKEIRSKHNLPIELVRMKLNDKDFKLHERQIT